MKAHCHKKHNESCYSQSVATISEVIKSDFYDQLWVPETQLVLLLGDDLCGLSLLPSGQVSGLSSYVCVYPIVPGSVALQLCYVVYTFLEVANWICSQCV